MWVNMAREMKCLDAFGKPAKFEETVPVTGSGRGNDLGKLRTRLSGTISVRSGIEVVWIG